MLLGLMNFCSAFQIHALNLKCAQREMNIGTHRPAIWMTVFLRGTGYTLRSCPSYLLHRRCLCQHGTTLPTAEEGGHSGEATPPESAKVEKRLHRRQCLPLKINLPSKTKLDIVKNGCIVYFKEFIIYLYF